MNLAVRDAESGQRGFLLTGKEDYLEPYQTALDRVGFLEGELQRLTADSAIERGRLRELAPLVQRKLEELAQTVQLRRTSRVCSRAGWRKATNVASGCAGWYAAARRELSLRADEARIPPPRRPG